MPVEEAATAKKVKVVTWSALEDRTPTYARVLDVDLVIIRHDDKVSVLYGRCQHRGALMANGYIDRHNLICGVHSWDYRYDTGVSEYNNAESLNKFQAWIDLDDNSVSVDENEIAAWQKEHPQSYRRDEYQGLYADIHGGPEEPYNGYIQELAKNGLKNVGHHGTVSAMGVPLTELPRWATFRS